MAAQIINAIEHIACLFPLCLASCGHKVHEISQQNSSLIVCMGSVVIARSQRILEAPVASFKQPANQALWRKRWILVSILCAT